MIYLGKLNIKLQAILDKNLDDIVAKKAYIPFIGNNYTKAELQAWLDERSKLLDYVKNHPDVNVNVAINIIYNSLSNEDKLTADKILTGEDFVFTLSGQAGYEKLVKIILYKFVTTE